MQAGTITSGISITKAAQSQATVKTGLKLSDFSVAATASTQVSISDAAKKAASGSSAPGKADAVYRIEGVARSVAETILEKNGEITVMKMTDQQIAEAKLHDEQLTAREAAINHYARQHPDTVYGQVMVDGKLFATAWAGGTTETPYQIPMTNDGEGTRLAEARLQDIAKATNGTIVYSDFVPVSSVVYQAIPDSVMNSMPQVTARSAAEIMQEVRTNPEMAAAQTLTFTSLEQWKEYMQGQTASQRDASLSA